MNNKEEFLQKREIWLKEVADQCHEYALEIDKDFYVFQTRSDLFRPEILFIGINPGGNKTYQHALKDIKSNNLEDRRLWTNLGYDSNTLVSKPDWETQNNLKGNDVMRSRLKLMFHSEYLFSKLEISVMMNMFYFNTKKANDIQELPNEIKKYCEAKTIEFINLIEPRNIIFFGSEANLKKIGLTNFNYLGWNIKTAKLDPLDVFILPHYGYFGAYSTEQGRATGDKLAEILK